MADELEPQFARDEDLERAKAFWKENGRSIIAGIVLGLSAIGGYNGWQWWQKNQGEGASMLYQNLLSSEVTDAAAAGLNADLRDDYSATPYAALAGLAMAKRAVTANDLGAAAQQLRWVLENGADQGVQHVARIRLAMVLLAQKDADGTQALLNGVESTEFAARYAELKGDAYAQKNDFASARIAYKESQELLPMGSANRDLLKLKIDNLGT